VSEITPAGVMAGFWKWSGVIIGALGLAALLIIGGKHFGWWLQAQDINHQTQNIQNSDSNQRSLVSDLTAKIGQVEQVTVQMDAASGQQLADLHAERLGIANVACNDAAQLSGSDVLAQCVPAWIRANCLAGSVSPSSALEK
jgi:hypothetical protein